MRAISHKDKGSNDISHGVTVMHQQQLPVRAAIEGPAACFRLLEIDDGSGMKHDQFVALLMTATDNR